MSIRTHLFTNLSNDRQVKIVRFRERIQRIVEELKTQPSALLALIILVSFLVMAVFAPYAAPYDPERSFMKSNGYPENLEPPSVKHPLGTNHLGQDVFSQWIYGARVSYLVGLLSGFTVMVVGTTVGVVSGYYKGTTDLVLMRIVDVMYGIPATPLILVLALFFGASIWNIIIAMALVLWRTMARVIRSQTLSLSERPFVKAARASGASDVRIMGSHILPNLLPLVFIETTFIVGFSIVLEAGISFLGLGATDMISWGTMLQLTMATGAISTAWWWVLPPGLGITLVVMSFFYLSRAIENISNPDAGRHQ